MMKPIKVRYWSLGSMIEQKLGGRIAEKIGKKAVSIVGGLSLGQLAAYIEQCDISITNGRGTMCMATLGHTNYQSVWARKLPQVSTLKEQPHGHPL